jgi:hypothetical protein
MAERLTISKLDAATSQLETALHLYFNEADPVSIHTLAAAAHQILQDLGSCQNSPMLLEQGMLPLPKELTAKIRALMREPQNFFKHADRNPTATVDFAPGLTEFILFDAVAKFRDLAGEPPLMLAAYELWFVVRFAEYWAHTPQHAIAQRAQSLFGLLSRREFITQFVTTTSAVSGVAPNPRAPDTNRALRGRRR